MTAETCFFCDPTNVPSKPQRPGRVSIRHQLNQQTNQTREEAAERMITSKDEPENKKPASVMTEKHAEARNALPEELLASFDALVEDYKFYASVHYGTRLVSYLILADLVRAGWRPSTTTGK